MNTTLEQVRKTSGATCPDWQASCVPDLDCNGSLRLFTEGDDLYDAMTAAIMQAERSIRLESFIFAGDAVGRQFAEVLSAKARDGVEVRFHFDSRGAVTGYSWPVFREMVSAGVKLKWYRPWSGVIQLFISKETTENFSLSMIRNHFLAVSISEWRTLAGYTVKGGSGIPIFLFEGLSSYEQLHSLISCGTKRSGQAVRRFRN